MLGCVIGDLAGSIYEYSQIKKISPISVTNLIEENSFFSDDTILMVAVLDAILNNKSYEESLKYWAKKYLNYLPDHKPYFKGMFSPGFTNWVNGDFAGTSMGNGCMMRIAPVGYLFNDEKEVVRQTRLATIPSHNTEESIKNASIVSLIIFYARQGLTKEEIIKKLKLKINKPQIDKFNYTVLDTIDVCLYSLFNSNSFENAIKLSLSFGGDSDTNACIVGGMAEAVYGVDEKLKMQALKKIPDEFKDLILKGYERLSGSENIIRQK